MISPRNPTLVLLAFACVPGRGSEPGAGWAAAVAADRWVAPHNGSVLVVTRSTGREEIADRQRRGELPCTTFRFIDLPRWLAKLTSGQASRGAFLIWQLLVLLSLRRIDQPVDIVHLATYATDAVPPVALLGATAGTRMWGPYGASEVVDAPLTWKRRSQRMTWTLIQRWAGHHVDRMLVQSSDVIARVARRDRAVILPNVVVDLSATRPGAGPWRRFPRQLATSGLLIARKRPNLAVSTLQYLPGDVGLVIVGGGDQMEDLRLLARQLGVDSRVHFAGAVSREESLSWIAASDALLHPSIREGSPWVVGEAIALGVPVVAVRGAGADYLIKESGDFGMVSLTSRPADLAAAVADVLSQARRQPLRRWTRDEYHERIAAEYDGMLDQSRGTQ